MTETLKILAPAKINLFLHITGRRADGYHDLESLIAFADMGDKITIGPAEEFSCKIAGPFAKELDTKNNSVIQAAHWVAEQCGQDLNLEITLTKNLPVAAGIGGGSSDAAATIKGLLQYWGEEHRLSELIPKSFSLGADVPVCLYGKPAFVKGAGDMFEPYNLDAPLHVVLANPLLACSTQDVFKAYAATSTAPASGERNDLQQTAQILVPEINEVLKALSGAGTARMSGSGATCFGIYEAQDKAQTAAEEIAKSHPDWWVKACSIK